MTLEARMAAAATKAAVCRRSGDTVGEDYWTEVVDDLAAEEAARIHHRPECMIHRGDE